MNEDNIYSTEALIAAIAQGFHPKYLFFWGHHPQPDGQIGKQCLSQWWGIGLAEDNPKAANPEQWQGLNLLGFALMKVRSRLASGKAA